MALIVGTAFADGITGSAGDDFIIGLAGNDTLRGESPNGSALGNDTLIGGPGNDVLDGAGLETPDEVDILIGGSGNDIFSLQDDGDLYDSLSVIVDFELSGDRISLPGSGASAFTNRFVFIDGSFEENSGAFLVGITPGNFGEQVAFFVNHSAGNLNSIFSGSSSPII
ncbi:hypothetical protein BJP34_19615 [Moorena producens PAL-8-15-08-1]|uniref:Calcium-binding protein n=1 Tax=Moorena producens PAL-8-15-08-1 TaxID=1458985 RepID=A0A1D8TUL8_9CYAN|nr:hypothetical protein [Moorena producens]AOX01352.1 hypothetical protein BJP34_19615 [Moorena producens PAL-8-15-08-1]